MQCVVRLIGCFREAGWCCERPLMPLGNADLEAFPLHQIGTLESFYGAWKSFIFSSRSLSTLWYAF